MTDFYLKGNEMNNQSEVNRVAELRRMPAAQRDRILEAAAELAADAYENDPELTCFEAADEVMIA